MVKKIFNMKIEGNIFSNKSFGKIDGKTVLVKGGIKGQEVEVKRKKYRKDYVEGRISQVLQASELETEVGCPHKHECGGCSYQSLTYENELDLKRNMYENLFKKEKISLGTDFYIEEAPDIHRYRNKMEYTFGDEYKGGPISLGMNKKGKFHEVVDVSQCNIVNKDFTRLLNRVLDYFQAKGKEKYNKKTHKGFLRHLVIRRSYYYQEILLNIVTSSQDTIDPDFVNYILSTPELEGKIAGILHTVNDSLGDVVKADKLNLLYGRDYIKEKLLDLEFQISPFSFFQTNSRGAEKLYSIVQEYVGQEKNDIVFDLYSGTGTIAQILAPVAKKVVGIEIVEEAVDVARQNARLNKLDNVEFIAGDVLKAVDNLDYKPSLIVLDPPREGINPKAIGKIIDFNPQVFVYVSCNPVTLLKDLKVFKHNGYKIVKSTGMDMFPRTPHCETVVLLEKE